MNWKVSFQEFIPILFGVKAPKARNDSPGISLEHCWWLATLSHSCKRWKCWKWLLMISKERSDYDHLKLKKWSWGRQSKHLRGQLDPLSVTSCCTKEVSWRLWEHPKTVSWPEDPVWALPAVDRLWPSYHEMSGKVLPSSLLCTQMLKKASKFYVYLTDQKPESESLNTTGEEMPSAQANVTSIWVNCYCWGNSSMVEGRFSKWF